MKKIMKTIAAGIIAISLTFTACNKEKNPAEISSNDSDASAIVELDEIETELYESIDYVNYVEADENSEPYLINDGIPCGVESLGDAESRNTTSSTNTLSTPCKTCNCNFLFKDMDLTDRQKANLRRAINEYDNCVKSARERLANLYNKHMEEYKLEYQKIQRMYRAGKITEDEYKRMIHRLNTKYREIFSNLNDRKLLCKAIAQCHRQYLSHVKRILTPRQWHKFMECQRRCIASNTRPQTISTRDSIRNSK